MHQVSTVAFGNFCAVKRTLWLKKEGEKEGGAPSRTPKAVLQATPHLRPLVLINLAHDLGPSCR